jgi:hypothetical protein
MVEKHDFGWALRKLKMGKRVTRPGWNGKGMWLTISTIYLPSDVIAIEPFILLVTGKTGGKAYAWTASQADIMATDWEVVG